MPSHAVGLCEPLFRSQRAARRPNGNSDASFSSAAPAKGAKFHDLAKIASPSMSYNLVIGQI